MNVGDIIEKIEGESVQGWNKSQLSSKFASKDSLAIDTWHPEMDIARGRWISSISNLKSLRTLNIRCSSKTIFYRL
jgi:hypothetical protein